MIEFIEHLPHRIIQRNVVEEWYHPIHRLDFIARWNTFLKSLLEFSLNLRRPIEIQFDTKYHDTMNDKIKVDKTPLKIETLNE